MNSYGCFYRKHFSMALNIPHKLFLKATEHVIVEHLCRTQSSLLYTILLCLSAGIEFPLYFGSFEKVVKKEKS